MREPRFQPGDEIRFCRVVCNMATDPIQDMSNETERIFLKKIGRIAVIESYDRRSNGRFTYMLKDTDNEYVWEDEIDFA